MKSRTNQLDPRIIGGLRSVLMPNDVLTEEKAARFSLSPLSTVGYAAECLMDFQDLGADPSGRLFRILKVNRGSPFPFRCRVVGNLAAEGDFSFFLPADQVAAYSDKEESKARPFTIREFENLFEPPCVVYYRLKNTCSPTRSTVIVGAVLAYKYIPGDDDSLEIVLSGMSTATPLKARWLFDHVEWSPSGDLVDWRPFGVDPGVYKYEK